MAWRRACALRADAARRADLHEHALVGRAPRAHACRMLASALGPPPLPGSRARRALTAPRGLHRDGGYQSVSAARWTAAAAGCAASVALRSVKSKAGALSICCIQVCWV